MGIIFLYSLETSRAGQSALRNIGLLRKAVLDSAARNVIIATTKWDLDEGSAQKRHDQLCDQERFFGALINDGAEVMASLKERRNEVLQALIQMHKSPIEYVLVLGATGAGKTSVSTLLLNAWRSA